MALNLSLPSLLQKLEYDLFQKHNVEVFIKRDDLIHPEISGNKWRKLKLNIEKHTHGKYNGLLTFGGAYSNHISATAATGKALGVKTIGYIRGNELTKNSNDTLKKASENGMELVFVTREEYSWKYERDYIEKLRSIHGNVLVVEEGGANYLGVMGCVEIVAEIKQQPDFYILAAGTGTTSAGVVLATDKATVLTVPVFKNGGFMRNEIANLLTVTGLPKSELDDKLNQLKLLTEFSFGGYGKFNQKLIDFINHIYSETGLKLDQIYTGKMFFALCDSIEKGLIPSGSKVVAIHTGGIQGTNSIKSQLLF